MPLKEYRFEQFSEKDTKYKHIQIRMQENICQGRGEIF